jgi:septal ring-binding cell division protein DamX
VAVAPVAAPAPVPEPKPEPKADPKPEPVVANGRDDKAWVEKLPAGGWMLQHAAFDTQQEIELLQSKQASFKEARVLKTKRKSGASYFILVTGPYATRQEAEDLIKTDPAMAKSWLRATKSVKIQFQD